MPAKLVDPLDQNVTDHDTSLFKLKTQTFILRQGPYHHRHLHVVHVSVGLQVQVQDGTTPTTFPTHYGPKIRRRKSYPLLRAEEAQSESCR